MTEKQIVWYILLTEVKIDSDTQSVTSLSVAPLAVLPEFQRKGIGGDVADIPFISDQLAIYEFYEGFVFQWFPVIHISRGYHKVQQLTPLVTYQMQLKAKEPSHGALASLRNALEYLVDMYPLVPAYSKGSAVHETYASTFSEQHLLDE